MKIPFEALQTTYYFYEMGYPSMEVTTYNSDVKDEEEDEIDPDLFVVN